MYLVWCKILISKIIILTVSDCHNMGLELSSKLSLFIRLVIKGIFTCSVKYYLYDVILHITFTAVLPNSVHYRVEISDTLVG